ncbi:TIGR02569 family protein [Amycolatopsis nigrescens]|uniref:TIGR02569 family protein n=1 Tax=Amycolatopsis nigrescens TaxID=381445 RepID=UPI0006851C4E|nr:TIGR02569 family protein [Amycolatopsis nigrescens]
MSPNRERPPEHVRAAFGVRGVDIEPLPGGSGWRCGDLVLKPVSDKAHAAWVARALDQVRLPELRVARPVRSTDGRWIIAGWTANRYVSGVPEPRHDEVVLAAVKLHQATVGVARPDFLRHRKDVDAVADRIAWEEAEEPIDEYRGGRWFEVLSGARRPIRLPAQVVHGELSGAVLFDGTAPPGVVDFMPYYRPAEWGAAIVAVDALAWGGADIELLHRWSHLPEWPQLLLRAMLFRLAAHALNPRSPRATLDGLHAAAGDLSELI